MQTTGRTWGILMTVDRVVGALRATHAIIVSNTQCAPAEYKCFKVIKPSNPFTNVWFLF